ncbi:MAG TPA: NADH-ubiquinone oxidoreductase-F iron-sulfur binding region domain-containing protein [Gaiellaceae bacterium]|nr:NADH-ubiquinone oxidoreductase-F iron-sulfur binding region domain-containing protein [Gaiellaceae bacterium]
MTVSLDMHARRHGRLEPVRDLISLVEQSGLTGRGGGAFPAASKLDAVRSRRGRPVVVVNGAEGEPASGKDKVLLVYAPHLVLDGAVLAARALGARDVIVATASRGAGAAVAAAAAERRDTGISLQRVTVPDRFVAGEETALVQFINGGACLPTLTPPRPFERGVGGAPTLVQNVETLAHVALIARYGPQWFRAVGTPEEPGSTLVTLSGAVQDPGVYEIPLGVSFDELLDEAGGAIAEIQAFLVGGYFGTWIDAADAASARLLDADLAPLRATLGARAIIALPKGACGVAETARVARYLAAESAGQCGPCVHGLAAIADDLSQLVARRAGVDEQRLHRRLGIIPGRGACRHPDGAVRLVRSALDVFAPEFARHFRGGSCTGTGRPVVPMKKER